MVQDLKEMVRMGIKPNFAALARSYDCDYRTAKKKYLEIKNQEKGIEVEEKVRTHLIDEYADIIDAKLQNVTGITASSIYYFLKTEYNYTGSYSSVRDYVYKNKDKRKKEASIRTEPVIGKSAQVDWKEDFKLVSRSGEEIKFNIFLLRLHYSKKFHAVVTLDKKKDEVKRCLIICLENIGGVPREIWFDNMSTVMVKVGKEKKVHNEIVQLANDLGFKPILCKARRPKTKGSVENLAKLCDRLVSYNNEFDTFEDIIDIVERFNQNCGKEVSQAHKKVVDEVFEEEKKYLIPLPNENILEKYKQNIEYRKVSTDSMIVYKNNRYSVPTRFIGTHVAIRIINDEIMIYDNDELVRCHKISNELLNYNKDDKLEILRSDLLYGLTDDQIEEKIKNSDLEIYDFLKGMN